MKKSNLLICCISIAALFILLVIYKNNQGPRVYVPGEHPRKGNPLRNIFGHHHRKSYAAHEKTYLKSLGATVAIYFSDGVTNKYPQNPQDFDMAPELFFARHLHETDKELPKDWLVPDTWQKFNQGEAPYVFVPSGDDRYSGETDKVLFIVRKGYQSSANYYHAVFEDGHVAQIKLPEAIQLWKKAGVWNE